MVKRHLRSTKMVAKKRALPSGITGIIFRKKKTNKPKSPNGEILNGTHTGRARDVRNLSKTQKRPTRYYGGVLSPRELKNKILSALSKQ